MINHHKTIQQGVHQGSATLSQSHGAESLSGWFHQQRWVCGQHNSWMVEHCRFSQLDWKRYNQISRNNGESVDYSWDNNIVTWGSRALLKSPPQAAKSDKALLQKENWCVRKQRFFLTLLEFSDWHLTTVLGCLKFHLIPTYGTVFFVWRRRYRRL